mgnify:FL=1
MFGFAPVGVWTGASGCACLWICGDVDGGKR